MQWSLSFSELIPVLKHHLWSIATSLREANVIDGLSYCDLKEDPVKLYEWAQNNTPFSTACKLALERAIVESKIAFVLKPTSGGFSVAQVPAPPAPMSDVSLGVFLRNRAVLRQDIVSTLGGGTGISARWWKVAGELSRHPLYNKRIDLPFLQNIEANYNTGPTRAAAMVDAVSEMGVSANLFEDALRATLLERLAIDLHNELVNFSSQPTPQVQNFIPAQAPTPAPQQQQRTMDPYGSQQVVTGAMTKKTDIMTQLKSGMVFMVRLPKSFNVRRAMADGTSARLEVLFCEDLDDANEQCATHLDDDIDEAGGEEGKALYVYATAEFKQAHPPKKRQHDRRVELSKKTTKTKTKKNTVDEIDE